MFDVGDEILRAKARRTDEGGLGANQARRTDEGLGANQARRSEGAVRRRIRPAAPVGVALHRCGRLQPSIIR